MANNHEQEIKELDKKIELQLSQSRELDGRLSSLQTKGFQLGSFYLVFQGVILTAIANANSVFGCLSYWLLIALSSLAAFPNLIAMYYIGWEYIRISTQRDKLLRGSDALFTQVSQLKELKPTSPGTSPSVPAPTSPAPPSPVAGTSPSVSAPTCPAPPSPVAGTSPSVSAPTCPSPLVAGTAPPPSQVAATAQSPPAGNHGYNSRKSMVTRTGMRIIFVVFCIAFYLGVSAIMYLVCIKTLRKPGAQCKQH